MPAGLTLMLNGAERRFDELDAGSPATALVQALGLRPDRVAVELNGAILPRERWADTALQPNDRLEVVHFVGGGCCSLTISDGSAAR